MTAPKPGDRVRVEFEGTVDYVATETVTIAADDGRRFNVPLSACTVIAPPLPPEPPVGSVVRDREGNVWVRRGGGWQCVSSFGWRSWPELLREYGPVTLLVPGDTLGAS